MPVAVKLKKGEHDTLSVLPQTGFVIAKFAPTGLWTRLSILHFKHTIRGFTVELDMQTEAGVKRFSRTCPDVSTLIVDRLPGDSVPKGGIPSHYKIYFSSLGEENSPDEEGFNFIIDHRVDGNLYVECHTGYGHFQTVHLGHFESDAIVRACESLPAIGIKLTNYLDWVKENLHAKTFELFSARVPV